MATQTQTTQAAPAITTRPRRDSRRRRVQFEIDDAAVSDSIQWADFLPSETKSPWPEVATSLSCSVALLCLFGSDNISLPLGIILSIFALHALLLLLLTGMRTCTRKFGPGMSGLRQLVKSLFHH